MYFNRNNMNLGYYILILNGFGDYARFLLFLLKLLESLTMKQIGDGAPWPRERLTRNDSKTPHFSFYSKKKIWLILHTIVTSYYAI